MQRIRIYYSKTQALRYTGSLDVHKIWERTLRRARLPLAYSQGFHPQPKINQACPLPLGMLSRAEIVDIWLEPELPMQQIVEQLSKSIPPGIEIDHLEAVDLHEPALQTRLAASRYQVTLLSLPEENQVSLKELSEKVNTILSSANLPLPMARENLRSTPVYPGIRTRQPGRKGTASVDDAVICAPGR